MTASGQPRVAQEQRLALSNGRPEIAIKVWQGSADKPPVLAVHGWLDNAASFDKLMAHWPEHTVYAVDLPGHGLSDHRPNGVRYHNADFLEDVYAIKQALFGERAIIGLGHSLGAGLLLLLAGIIPEQFQQLILIDGLGPITAAPEDYPKQTRETLESYRVLQPISKGFATLEQAIQARMQGMTGPLSSEAAAILCERGLRQTEQGWQWTTDRRLRWSSLMRFSEAQLLACIAAIECPTLLISGDYGMLKLLESHRAAWQQRLDAFKHLRHEQLPGGHHLHLDEQPQACARLMAEFLG